MSKHIEKKSLVNGARHVRRRLIASDCKVCDADQAFLRLTKRPTYENITPKLRVADVFCGCGGLSLGVAEAARQVGLGLEVRVAIDYDKEATAVYGKNFPKAIVRCSPVQEIFDGELGSALTAGERRLTKDVGKIDVLVGGPPCQGYSDLNNHTRRCDPRNALYAKMARAAEVLNPTVVLIENVPTARHDVNRVVDVTINVLRGLEYAVHDRVLDLSLLGAPQHRRRHVVLAIQDSGCNPKQTLDSMAVRCGGPPSG